MRALIAALVLLAPAAHASTNTGMNVVVEKITGFTVCPGVPYKVAGANVVLDSPSIDLEPFVGKQVRLTGRVQNPGLCPPFTLFIVDGVEQATATLDVCGVPRPGCSIGFLGGPPTISVNAHFASIANPGFVDLGPLIGVAFLGAPSVFLGTSGPTEVLEVQIPPGTPIGLTIYAQTYHLDVGPILGPGALSNPVSFQTLAVGIPCIDPSTCF